MIEAIVVQRNEEADGICSFELAAADGSTLPHYEPGSHIDVSPVKGLTRQYSLCASAQMHGRYLIAVLREPASRGGSQAMHALEEGAKVFIGEPRNFFPLVAKAKRHVLIAGGIGITPLLAMAEHLGAGDSDLRLHYCARSASRMAFRERITKGLLGRHSQLHFDDGPVEQKFDFMRAVGAPEDGTHVYVCGPTGFMAWVLSSARELGWPEEQVHTEYFAAQPVTATEGDTEFEVQLGDGGPVHRVPAGETVVQALAAHGVDIPVSCEAGVCGTCVTRILLGEPEHRDSFLTEKERAKNDRFTPCCSRSRSRRLVLDL